MLSIMAALTLAEALGKSYTITQLTVSTGGGFTPPMMRSAKAMSAEMAMPMEGGESMVTATVSGKIELE